MMQTCDPPEALKNALLSRTDELMMLPEVANEALQMAKDPDCSTGQFANVVERDVKLATEILSLANSAIFAGGSAVSNLRQAIVRLGFRQCRNLILASSTASLMKSLPLEQEWIRELIWQHSFRAATACMYLNRSLNLRFEGEEFTAGLLHDFGRLLLAIAAPEDFQNADALSFHEHENLLADEQMILGIDHACFGAWFAQQNGLPESLVSSILLHHEPRADHPDAKLIALTAAGDHIANHFQRCEEATGYDPAENVGVQVLEQIGCPGIIDQFQGIASTLLNEVLKDTDGSQ